MPTAALARAVAQSKALADPVLPHWELPSVADSTLEGFPGRTPFSRGCPASLATLTDTRVPIQEAQQKLRVKIYRRVNTANLLLCQVRQRRQARHELQRRLQQLQREEELEEKGQQKQVQVLGTPCWGGSTHRGLYSNPCTPRGGLWAQHRGSHPVCVSPPSPPQVIRQLKNNIEKMALKIQASEKVAALYLKLRDVLRKVGASSPRHRPALLAKATRSPRGRAGGRPARSARPSCSPPSRDGSGSAWGSAG